MTRDDFIRTCDLCGYATKKAAAAYADTHPNLTDADYIEVSRLHDGNLANEGTWYSSMSNIGVINANKGKTSKRLHNDSRDMQEEDNR